MAVSAQQRARIQVLPSAFNSAYTIDSMSQNMGTWSTCTDRKSKISKNTKEIKTIQKKAIKHERNAVQNKKIQ